MHDLFCVTVFCWQGEMQFLNPAQLLLHVRHLRLSFEPEKNEIVIMQKNYAELCRFMQKYAFSGRIAPRNPDGLGRAAQRGCDF